MVSEMAGLPATSSTSTSAAAAAACQLATLIMHLAPAWCWSAD